MREQLIRYVDLLFAGAPNAGDIKQEILQNTLDRYDDLIAQGKSPEAAYSLSIAGIGDISEILGNVPRQEAEPSRQFTQEVRTVPVWKKILRAVAICLYIISIIPLIVLAEFGMETLGLCGTIAIVAVATALIILSGGKGEKRKQEEPEFLTPQQEMRRSIRQMVRTVSVCVYLIVSFLTGAWEATWIIFPLGAAVRSLIYACMDLKEANSYEN